MGAVKEAMELLVQMVNWELPQPTSEPLYGPQIFFWSDMGSTYRLDNGEWIYCVHDAIPKHYQPYMSSKGTFYVNDTRKTAKFVEDEGPEIATRLKSALERRSELWQFLYTLRHTVVDCGTPPIGIKMYYSHNETGTTWELVGNSWKKIRMLPTHVMRYAKEGDEEGIVYAAESEFYAIGKNLKSLASALLAALQADKEPDEFREENFVLKEILDDFDNAVHTTGNAPVMFVMYYVDNTTDKIWSLKDGKWSPNRTIYPNYKLLCKAEGARGTLYTSDDQLCAMQSWRKELAGSLYAAINPKPASLDDGLLEEFLTELQKGNLPEPRQAVPTGIQMCYKGRGLVLELSFGSWVFRKDLNTWYHAQLSATVNGETLYASHTSIPVIRRYKDVLMQSLYQTILERSVWDAPRSASDEFREVLDACINSVPHFAAQLCDALEEKVNYTAVVEVRGREEAYGYWGVTWYRVPFLWEIPSTYVKHEGSIFTVHCAPNFQGNLKAMVQSFFTFYNKQGV